MKFIGLGAPELVIILAPLLLAAIPAYIAHKKGRSAAAYYVFGVFLWVPALIVALVVEERPSATASELVSYKQLLDQGAITQEEFDEKKAALMGPAKPKGEPERQ